MERAALEHLAAEYGFGGLGICCTAGFGAQKSLVDMQPRLKERAQLCYFPQDEYPWATALAVLLWPYAPASLPQKDREVYVDSYYFASNAAYHAAKQMEAALRQAGYRAQANVSYPAKAAAVRAGLGVIGRHSMLITPEFGSRVVIILMATDAIDAGCADAESQGECLRCGRCVKACPSGALDENGMSHPERCLRNFMMEGITAPPESRKAMGMRLIGCDSCQRACPMQRLHEEPPRMRFTLDMLMTADTQQFSAAVRQLGVEIGRNTARPQRVRAQAALLAGNSRREADLPVLREWVHSEFDAVKAHAGWAIEQINPLAMGLDQCDEKR